MENNTMEALANVNEGMMELTPIQQVTPVKAPKIDKNKVAAGILIGDAAVGTAAIVAWAVFGGVKLGKFIKKKAAEKKAAVPVETEEVVEKPAK